MCGSCIVNTERGRLTSRHCAGVVLAERAAGRRGRAAAPAGCQQVRRRQTGPLPLMDSSVAAPRSVDGCLEAAAAALVEREAVEWRPASGAVTAPVGRTEVEWCRTAAADVRQTRRCCRRRRR